MGLMNSTWVIDGHDIATAFDLSSFNSIIDLGGKIKSDGSCDFSAVMKNKIKMIQRIAKSSVYYCKKTFCVVTVKLFAGCSGALAREIAKEYPSSTVTVLDLPEVIQSAQRHFAQQDDTICFQEGVLKHHKE